MERVTQAPGNRNARSLDRKLPGRTFRGVPVSVWILGLLVGLAVGGWTFQGDFLLNWDQVIGPEIPIPPGLWGLGPELPRRTPFYVPLALASQLIGGPQTVGLVIVGSVMLAVAGATRLARPDVAGAMAGLVYGLSPFLLSRAAVGHIPLVVAASLLPWLLHRIGERTEGNLIWWAVLLGLTGSSGAALGLVPIGIALRLLATGQGPNHLGWPIRLRRIGLLILSQASWTVPGLVAVLAGTPFPTSETSAFTLKTAGIGGLSRVFAGGGLFLQDEDVTYRAGLVAAALGLVLLGAGVVGLRNREQSSGKSGDILLTGSLVGAVLVFLPSVPVLSDLWGFLVSLGPLGVFRESHKFWPLLGLALVVGLASFLRSFCGDVVVVFGVALVGLLVGASMPGLFGADGRLVAIEAPPEWADAHDLIQTDPGRLVVYPWRRYDQLALASDRTVLQPAPWILPGTVLISGDAGNEAPSVERVQGVEVELASLDGRVRAGRTIMPELRDLGIGWVLVMNGTEADFYRRLGREDGARLAVDSADFQLYEVGGNQATVDWSGSDFPLHPVVGPAVWDRECEKGWLLDWAPVQRAGDRCLVPDSGGVLWYPPAMVSLAGLLLSLGTGVAVRPRWVGTRR